MKWALRPFGRIVRPFFTPSTKVERLIRSQSSAEPFVAVQGGDVPVRRHLDPLGIGEAVEDGEAAREIRNRRLVVDRPDIQNVAGKGHAVSCGARSPRAT